MSLQTKLFNSYWRDFVNQSQKMCRTTRLVKQIFNLLNDSIISSFYLFPLFMLLLHPLRFRFTLGLLFLLRAQILLKSSKALSLFFLLIATWCAWFFLNGSTKHEIHLFVLRCFALSFYVLMSQVMQSRVHCSEVVKKWWSSKEPAWRNTKLFLF